ncbi:MAG: hypothetical protein ACJ8AD_13640, partial [Gemmatimonadaceae bacterium]
LFRSLAVGIALVVGIIPWMRGSASPLMWSATMTFAVVYVASQVAGTAVWAINNRLHGTELSWDARSAPALLERAGALPLTSRVYSNMPEAIYYATGRIVFGVPPRFSPTSLRPNPDLAAEIDAMASRTGEPTYVVVFDAGADRTFLATAGDIRRRLVIQRVEMVRGGRILTIGPQPARRAP